MESQIRGSGVGMRGGETEWREGVEENEEVRRRERKGESQAEGARRAQGRGVWRNGEESGGIQGSHGCETFWGKIVMEGEMEGDQEWWRWGSWGGCDGNGGRGGVWCGDGGAGQRRRLKGGGSGARAAATIGPTAEGQQDRGKERRL